MPESEGEYLTAEEVGRLLNRSARTINRWADAGRIPCVVNPGGHKRFRRTDFEGWGDWGGPGLSGDREPRRPRPSLGTGGVALPEP